MAIYLFVLLFFGLLINLCQCVFGKDRPTQIGCLIEVIITLPPYIWYGWGSGLVF